MSLSPEQINDLVCRRVKEEQDRGSNIAGLKTPASQRHHPGSESTILGFGDHTGTVISICDECGAEYFSDSVGAYKNIPPTYFLR